MRAVTIPDFGGPEVLTAADVPVPRPGPGEVAVDVAYAGVTFADIMFRQGLAQVPLPFIPGIEVAGHIRELGNGATGLRVGQPVVALTTVAGGGYAELVVVDARLVAPVPEGFSLDVAAGIPVNTTTAVMALGTVAHLAGGESVLVHAAAGGVGGQLGQVARLRGARRVVGTVGRIDKVPEAMKHGFHDVVVRDDLTETGFDVVVDSIGGPTRRASLDATGAGGRLVLLGNASGAPDVAVGTNDLFATSRSVLGYSLGRLSDTHPDTVGAALRDAVGAVTSGDVQVALAAVLPLTDAGEAHRRIGSGASTGKFVLQVA
ncbi:quinone oxidoreductase family protein [Jiangella alkaliphila]|uniref:NADPH2:quinone reductase n=1 Tax=Jiangella alkaliphila TaxID=419479 RepID=A0A1H2LE34_9ACTN|nr:zinc-binding dehydrogenase [Jiangella alkaliphila]SDU78686.1 NADPH2:quinone reductase [Jiangella alkaliphila]